MDAPKPSAAVVGPAMYDLEHLVAASHNAVTSPALGQSYLLTDSGQLVSNHASGSTTGASTATGVATGSPTSTLVGSASGLQIDLVWDTSVRSASNWSAIEAALVSAAKVYTGSFTNHMLVTIDIGLGEINGSGMSAGALGESESSGYIVNYSTEQGALKAADAALVSSGQMASTALNTNSAYATANFFVSSAEAKALGLVNPTASGVDGYIGLTAGSALSFAGKPGASQYDAIGVAAHEISEVMGRIAEVGAKLGSYSHTYTALDLFRYSAKNTAALSAGTASYFSVNNGATALTAFNTNSQGDAGDWATATANTGNAYNAFGNPGVNSTVTATDLLEIASLGYHLAKAPTSIAA